MSQQQHTNPLGDDSQRNHSLSDAQLLAYMEGKLSKEERRLIEEHMSEENADADAIEGLQLLQADETKQSLAELQRRLHSELSRSKARRKGKMVNDYWGWIAIVIVLMLLALGYMVVWLASK